MQERCMVRKQIRDKLKLNTKGPKYAPTWMSPTKVGIIQERSNGQVVDQSYTVKLNMNVPVRQNMFTNRCLSLFFLKKISFGLFFSILRFSKSCSRPHLNLWVFTPSVSCQKIYRKHDIKHDRSNQPGQQNSAHGRSR